MSQPQQQQQQQRRFQPCRNGCGVDIFFDAKLGRTPTGGWIPMQFDSIRQAIKHDCPNKKQQQPQQQQMTTTTNATTDDTNAIAATEEQGEEEQQQQTTPTIPAPLLE